MGNLIIIAAILLGVWWFKKQGKPSRDILLGYGRTLAGVLLVGAGALMLSRGQFVPAAFSGLLGASLLGWDVMRFFKIGGAARVSRFYSAFVDLEVDNLTRRMDGIVKIGKYAGQRLSQLSESAIQEILNSAVRKRDADSAGLLEAYLHRRSASGRENAERDRDAGTGGRAGASAVSEQEAYDILGLKPGASTDEIKGAYRTLIKKLHPDHGGTAYLAARINEAKDVLLNRHR